jgi:hypothetical protein
VTESTFITEVSVVDPLPATVKHGGEDA